MGVLQLRLLGGFRAERGQGVPPVARWTRPGARTLVKLLAVTPGHQLHRERVMAVCWPHAELSAAQRSLRVALHAARHALEPELAPRAPSSYLVADGALLRLAPDAVLVDADRAETAAERALREGAVRELVAAWAEFTGELLPEDRYAAWAEPRRARLADLRDRVGIALATARLAEGRPEEAAAVARHLVEQAPADERVHRLLIEAYARQGRYRAAVRQYEACAQALAAEHGVPPGPETVRLHRAALDGRRPRWQVADPAEADAARVRFDWARTLERSGRYDEAIRVLREALASYEQQGRADARAMTAARLAEVLARHRTSREAHAVLAAHPPGAEAPAEVRATCRLARAMALFHEGDYEAGLRAAREAQEMVEGAEAYVADLSGRGRVADGGEGQAARAGLLARALGQQATCNGLLGRFDAAQAPARRALAAAERADDPALLATVLSVLRENARRAGDHEQAVAHGRRALALAEQQGRPTATAFERANLAEIQLLLGATDEADRLARAAVELAEPFGGTVLAFALTALARVRMTAEPGAADALLARAALCAVEGGHRQAVDEVRTARAEWEAARR